MQEESLPVVGYTGRYDSEYSAEQDQGYYERQHFDTDWIDDGRGDENCKMLKDKRQ